jgi:predicted permease
MWARSITGIPLDWRVFAFGLVASLGAGLVTGLVPGLLARRTELAEWLKQAARSTTRREGYARLALTTVQLAASLVLLVVAVLFVRTLMNLNSVELGFDPEGVTVFHLDPGEHGYEGDRLGTYLDELERRVRELPGVESASLSSGVPFSGGFSYTRVHRAGEEAENALRVNAEHASPELFETLRLPVLRGGGFGRADVGGGSVMLSASLARELYRDADPLGRYVSFPVRGEQGKRYAVIGVVGDSRWRGLDQGFPLFVYQPYLPERSRVLAVRSARPVADLVAAVNATAASLDPSMPLFGISTAADLIKRELSERRVFARLVSLLSVLALTLAAVGMYGLVAYGAETRVREFGIRIALGAERHGIAALAMRQGVRLVVLGVVLGGAGGAFAARIVQSRLFGVTPFDVTTFALAAILLAAAALVACYLPARRAAMADPVAALRSE